MQCGQKRREEKSDPVVKPQGNDGLNDEFKGIEIARLSGKYLMITFEEGEDHPKEI